MRTVLIMGSSGGLGQALCRHFDALDFQLALHYHGNTPDYIPDGANLYQADIRSAEAIKQMTDEILSDFGSVDIIIHNAGVSISEISWKISDDNWNDTISVNLTAPFMVSRNLIPAMREQNYGRIIFISSIVAQTGFAGAAAYGASKAGLIGLTKSLAKELSSKNITANAIALGYFDTGMINDVPYEMQEQLKESIPLNRLGDPMEFNALIDYLISDEAEYMTGQTLNLNGGLYS